MYLVAREGIYMQGIVGIFNDIDLATNAAISAKSQEKDEYHKFYIYKVTLNPNEEEFYKLEEV